MSNNINLNLNLNLNNKFGECCSCPALITNDLIFNNYISARIYNDSIMKSIDVLDTHKYRSILQSDKNIVTNKNKFLKCKSNNKNLFYIDSSKYNFNIPLNNEYNGPNKINNDLSKPNKSSNYKFI